MRGREFSRQFPKDPWDQPRADPRPGHQAREPWRLPETIYRPILKSAPPKTLPKGAPSHPDIPSSANPLSLDAMASSQREATPNPRGSPEPLFGLSPRSPRKARRRWLIPESRSGRSSRLSGAGPRGLRARQPDKSAKLLRGQPLNSPASSFRLRLSHCPNARRAGLTTRVSRVLS